MTSSSEPAAGGRPLTIAVLGLGFAATRDLISFLRYDVSDNNPLLSSKEEKSPRWAMGFGSSQSGRFLKDLIYHGFNQDDAGRIISQ